MSRSRLLNAQLAAALALLALLVADVSAADAGFAFSKNPPGARHDYFSVADPDRRRRAIVEKHHWDDGIRALAAGRHLEAHNNLDHILRYVPNHPHALDQYSRLSMARGKPDAAIPYFEFALEFRPETVSTYLVYGIHRYRAGQFERAARLFREAVSLAPGSAEAHYNLGLALVELERYAEARRHAIRAYELQHPLPGLKRRLKELDQWVTSTGTAPQ